MPKLLYKIRVNIIGLKTIAPIQAKTGVCEKSLIVFS